MKRTLKLQVQISVDGYIAGANGEMDWLEWNWDEKLRQYVGELTETVDTIILGRKLAEGFIPHWSAIASNPDDPEYSAGRKFTDTPKVVFTRTLHQSEWDHTVLAKGELTEEVNRLKNQDGKDIMAYGGASFVSSLIKHRLIDEFHLFVNPTAIGNGKPVFRDIEGNQNLALVKATPFDCGIVVLNYRLR